MRCKYCNCLLEECDNGVCRWCGKDNNININSKFINKTYEEINHEHIKNEEFTTTNDDLDNQLIKDYIGPNYQNLIRGGFSLPALLFGTYYFCYRKFWILGIISFFISLLVGIFGIVFTRLVGGFIFKDSYIDFVRRKITQYRFDYPNYSYRQLSGMCETNGGVSIGFLVFPIILYIIIILIFIMFMK
ncbi:MAG: DUF2628 domain-containing protein [Bacilli bacterium]|nr:DUF2628 domain-containing protein [Bacilli bacterium]